MKIFRCLSLLMLLVAASAPAATAASPSSTPDAIMTRRTYKAISYTEIEASTGVVVNFHQSDTPSLTISAPKYLFALLKVDVKGSSLDIGFRNINNRKIADADRGKVTIAVSAPRTSSFEVSTGAIININGKLKVNKELSFEASTGGIINAGSAEAAKVEVEVTTGGIANIDGIKTGSLEVEASTGAVANLSGEAGEARLEATTGAICNVENVKCNSIGAGASTAGIVSVGQKPAYSNTTTGGLIRVAH